MAIRGMVSVDHDHWKREMMRKAPGMNGSGRSDRPAAATGVARIVAACVLLLAGAGAAAVQQADAQAPAAASTAAEGNACFQPRPLPACRSFWITEFGVQWFISRPPGVNNQRRLLATWEVGWMRNRTADDAVGGSVFLSANDHALRSGVRARYRHWTGDGTAVDLSPALVVLQADENLEVRARLGAALQAGVTYHDWIGLTTQVEAASGGVRFQAGVRLGGYPGAAAGAALPLFALWAARHDES
ncbi:MAG TPA: hypothetical protein VGO40_08790 [Longimicrobium sp.]|jgi:hypothetical protein|nr:hypothetical protein [Longimicrobium sp.]